MLALAGAVFFLASAVVSCMSNSCQGLGCLDDMPSVNLLQVQSAYERKDKANSTDFHCAPIYKVWDEDERYQKSGVCGWMNIPELFRDKTKYHKGSQFEKELERPLTEIRKEHGAEDLFLYFGYLNDWINPGSAFDVNKLSYEDLKKTAILSQGSKYPAPVDMTFKWDGNEIHTRQDHVCQTGDDPYCFANGWMKNQNPALNPATFNDPAAYLHFAKDQCQQMNERYNFDADNITMLMHTQEDNAMYDMIDNACNLMPTKGPLPTNRDFQKHSYVKCLMNNALTEIAYCYFRGCVLEGNRIGHGDECNY